MKLNSKPILREAPSSKTDWRCAEGGEVMMSTGMFSKERKGRRTNTEAFLP